MRSLKPVCVVAIVALVIASSLLTLGAKPDQGRTPGGYDVVAVFPVGWGDRDATVTTLGGDGLVGPESFWVTNDGRVLLLDSQRERILVSEDGVVDREIPLPSSYWPRDLVVRGNRIFVLDGESPQVFLLDLSSGALVTTLPLPPGAHDDGVGQLHVTPDQRVVLEADGTSEVDIETGRADQGLSRHGGGRSVVSVSNGKAAIAFGHTKTEFALPGPFGSIRQIGTDTRGNTVVEVAGVRGKIAGNLSVDLKIHRVGGNGKKLGSYTVPLDEYVTFPNRFAQVTPPGDIYIMVVGSDRVEIRRVYPDDPEPQGDTAAAGSYAVMPLDVPTVDPLTLSSGATVDRNTARQYADCTIMQEWTYNAANGQHSQRTDVQKPSYLVSVPYGTYMQGALAGVPYCWGGYDGYNRSSCSQWTSFADAMYKGALAGNTLCSGSWKSGTAGIDCSGFVACNVGWASSTHPAMSDERAQSYLIPPDLLQPMDIFVLPGSHILHFVGLTGSGQVMTKEATCGVSSNQPGQKAKNYTRTWAYLATNGYEPRTFWANATWGTNFNTAADVPVQLTIGGYCNTAQQTWYKFLAQSGATYTVTVAPSSGDPSLYLYNPSNVQVGSSVHSGTVTEQVSYAVTSRGYYRIKIVGATATAWKLTVSCGTPGATLDNATTYSGPCYGSVVLDSANCYKFSANEGDQVTVTLSSYTGQMVMYVYDLNRVNLGNAGTPTTNSVTFMANTTSSSYYVKVLGLETADYTLDIERTPTSGDPVLYGSMPGTIVQGQCNYWRFFVACGDTFTVTAAWANDGNREMHVYDPNSSEIYAQYGYGPAECSYTAATGGVYEVMLTGAAGDYWLYLGLTQH